MKQTFSTLKAAFEKRFPLNGSKVFDLWYHHLVDPLHCGYWRDDAFGLGQRPTNTSADLQKGWGRKLSKTGLFSHFLASERSEYVYYVANAQNVFKDFRLVVPMLDVDDKHGGGDAQAVWDKAKSCLKGVRCYSCPSTSGNGIHGYACFGFPSSWSAEAISAGLTRMGQRLTEIVNDGTCKAQFDRLTGLPWYYAADGSMKRGTLGKVPSFSSDDQAGDLFTALSEFTEWEQVVKLLDLGEPTVVAPRKSSVSPVLPSAPAQELEDKRDRSDTEQLAGSSGSPKNLTSLPVQLDPSVIVELSHETDTLKRRQGFSLRLCRLAGRPLSAIELIGAYEGSGLATGPRTAARSKNFEQIADFIESAFDPEKAGQGRKFEEALAQARQTLAGRITEEVVFQRYGKQVNRSKLTVEDVAVVYGMYLYFSARKKNVSIARTAAHSFSQQLCASGAISRSIDHKRFAAAKRLLEELGLIVLVQRPKKGAWAAAYRVTKTAPISAIAEGKASALETSIQAPKDSSAPAPAASPTLPTSL